MLGHLLAAMILLLWAGMVLGISFLEAWVKFKAPSLTKAVGLDVGRTVFRASQNAQWGFLIILLAVILFAAVAKSYFLVPLLLGALLSLQVFWLFPKLNQRAELIIANKEPGKDKVHVLYGFLEVIKLFLLLSGGICFLMS
ncbi:MAG: hypothetical protein K0S08_1995 [Gammaproteobacteria bacterium]|jgi:hypothetical protein|nr:hypothetical protein [Gammaproteobacteria bacterium]MCE3238246.1 hypothetical protein [Gammaproteobacteria bacterium]